MTLRAMLLESVVWDDGSGTATFTLRERDHPAPPTGGVGWWSGPGASVTMTVPVKKNATVTNPTGIQLTTAPDGTVIYTKYELRNGTWVSLGRVNPDGTPWTG